MLSRREFTVSVLGATAAATRVAGASSDADGPAGRVGGDRQCRRACGPDARRGVGTAARRDGHVGRSRERVPRADRRLQPEDQRVHHRHARAGAGAGAGRSTPSSAPASCAARCTAFPIALKDNIDTAGVRTTAASAVFDDRVPAEDAEVARRLAAAGAVVIGKLNLHEFAFGGTSATSYYGPVRNPWALERNPGGSSGGSAAAVATDLCYGALGTDTGGSIRTPASYCSIVGLKPTYGLVSIRGIIPLTLSLDHCGPMTRSVLDAAMMLNVLAGYDRLDIASVEHAAGRLRGGAEAAGERLADRRSPAPRSSICSTPTSRRSSTTR